MNFSEALEAMKTGKKIRRSYWENEEFAYCLVSKVVYACHTKEFEIKWRDILADDWEIVNDN